MRPFLFIFYWKNIKLWVTENNFPYYTITFISDICQHNMVEISMPPIDDIFDLEIINAPASFFGPPDVTSVLQGMF